MRSYYVLPPGTPAVGLLVMLHTAAAPRGFTPLCLALGGSLRTAVYRADADMYADELEARAHA